MLSRIASRSRRFSSDKSASAMLAEELRNNPNFNKAFPHLTQYTGRLLNDIPQEELGFIKSLL